MALQPIKCRIHSYGDDNYIILCDKIVEISNLIKQYWAKLHVAAGCVFTDFKYTFLMINKNNC